MYPSQVLKHMKHLDPSPGTIHKLSPVSPQHEISFTHFFHPNSYISNLKEQPSQLYHHTR
uniref:Uncharacterized protein n=1 Tax=Arundo donax TaxID=35708 RepID=A0A0A9NN66_ARUDO